MLKLREKTVVICGPIEPIVQSLASFFVEQGSDVALIDTEASKSFRFINNLMDMRQIHSSYGRSAHIDCDFSESENIKEAVSRAAELFGSVDIFIDAFFLARNLGEGDSCTERLTKETLEFFIGRKKGRVIYLMVEEALIKMLSNDEAIIKENEKLIKLCKKTATEVSEHNITANAVSIGASDEFLIHFKPDSVIKDTLAEIKKEKPHTKITDPSEVAHVITFLASPISSAINGQHISLSHGLNI